MEFNEKLQELRRKKGLTQEELAQKLFVSRTAISKWESGRGYPSIDSLKEIAKFFSISIDELLSSNEVLTLAEEDSKEKERRSRDLVYALLDLSVLLLLFLPFFGQKSSGIIQDVSLLALTSVSVYIKVAYLVVVSLLVIFGVLTLALQNCKGVFWNKYKSKISIILSIVAVFTFIISPQPFAATLLFIFLVIKVLMLIKK
ncbi:MAG: helix-turn-helix transcriptional regulator [Ruminococcus sp.]|nr:helix-turn-helix transcriptional regulator [Ruminococcus sp.]